LTLENVRFSGALAGSLLLHVVFYFFLFALPAGTPDPDLVRVYRVKVVEAPPRPKVRRLDVSTAPISELSLEAPSLSLDTPPESAPSVPDAPPTAPPLETAVPPSTPRAAAPAQPPPTLPRSEQAPLPALPQSSAAPAAPSPPRPPAPARESVPPAPLTPSAVGEERPPSALEEARSKVEQLRLRPPAPTPPVTAKRLPRSRVSLRMYKATVQEEVQEKYQFPGGFDKALWVRVRITIERNGAISSVIFLERSGNEHFDRAALLSIRRTKLPPIPDGIEDDTISQVVVFRP